MQRTNETLNGSQVIQQLAIFLVPLCLALLSGCSECKSATDCKAGQICTAGECKNVSIDTDTNTDTETEDIIDTTPTDTGTVDTTTTDTTTVTDTEEPTDTEDPTDTETSGTDTQETDTETFPEVCNDPLTDCPTPENECRNYICEAEKCVGQDLNGETCDVGTNLCLSGLCVAGACATVPLSNTACQSDDNICTMDICMSGVCQHAPGNTGNACESDENPCTEDVCYDGVCGKPLSGISCGEGSSACATSECQSGTCQFIPLSNNAPCDDGLWCNGSSDACQEGYCIPASGSAPCEIPTTCHLGVCTEPTGEATTGTCEEVLQSDVSCDDGAFCNGTDVCINGSCASGPAPCGANSTECNVEVCDEAADDCSYQSKANGSHCLTQDGLACNGTEKCENAVCVLGAAYCQAFSDCTAYECIENGGDPYCTENSVDAADGVPCQTSTLCDGAGTRACVGGLCADGEIPACAPLEQDGDLCSRYLQCVVETGEPNCMFEDTDPELDEFLDATCGDTVDVSTVLTNNESSSYSGTNCDGNFTGGEQAIRLNIDSGTGFTATITTIAANIPSLNLWMLLVSDACDADDTCTQKSETTITGTAGAVPSFIVIDGIDGNRGTATVSITCP